MFSSASSLSKHYLTHSQERKHVCRICSKAFKRQDHLYGGPQPSPAPALGGAEGSDLGLDHLYRDLAQPWVGCQGSDSSSEDRLQLLANRSPGAQPTEGHAARGTMSCSGSAPQSLVESGGPVVCPGAVGSRDGCRAGQV